MRHSLAYPSPCEGFNGPRDCLTSCHSYWLRAGRQCSPEGWVGSRLATMDRLSQLCASQSVWAVTSQCLHLRVRSVGNTVPPRSAMRQLVLMGCDVRVCSSEKQPGCSVGNTGPPLSAVLQSTRVDCDVTLFTPEGWPGCSVGNTVPPESAVRQSVQVGRRQADCI